MSATATTGTVAAILAALDALVAAKPGYSQGAKARWSALDAARRRFVPGRDVDCSSAAAMVLYVAGLLTRAHIAGTLYSGNLAAVCRSAGMRVLSVSGLRTLTALRAALQPGDVLVGPGHVVIVGRDGRWWSPERDERGKSSGGKPGNQGDKVSWRAPYLRPRGWTYLIRTRVKATPSAATLRGRILAAISKGTSYTADAKTLAQVDGWRGERFGWMAGHIAAWNRGVALTLDARTLKVPGKGHAFVVLGAGAAEMARRLAAGLPAILANPASKVIVTGAPLRGGVTEAEWMRRWLIGKGVPSGRILVEPKATSTVGNALHSVALLQAKGLTTYTLISAASHLRRAQIHFLAARVKAEMAIGRKTGLATAGLIAYDDYAPKPIKPTLPIGASSRASVMAEVASLLGLTSQYKAAL